MCESAQVRFLDGVLRRIRILQDAARGPKQPAVVAAHKRLEGARISGASPIDEQQVRQVAQ
jgi:hypothetical protein